MSKESWCKKASSLFLLCAATAIGAGAQTFTTLVSFNGENGDGPLSLVQGTDGNLYGTTEYGGPNDAGFGGTVFKVTPTGTLLTRLYSFCSLANCADGDQPGAGLVLGSDGNFYGTTSGGGIYGHGTVFKITPSGTLTTLHCFNGTDGADPVSPLVQGSDGSFYGAAGIGGAGDYDDGTLFKITPDGTLTALHSFDGTDGYFPNALVEATDGNFYGTTERGGANDDGTVFRITPEGTLTTLASFDGTDGGFPVSGLIQADDGNFYGTTFGAPGTDGSVFEINQQGTLTNLHSFDGSDGSQPYAPLVQATDGNFYGTTSSGGSINEFGTVFKITPAGALTKLHTFEFTDGDLPYGGLVQATNGTLYGTTFGGGVNGFNSFGTVFSLGVGLGPFVETVPSVGQIGTTVRVLGTNLTGATSVTFNGSPAKFTVISQSLIEAKVPVGATSGLLQVVTPSGVLRSNVPFQVE
jgi:uncharacterized repeat protein (TIGR03803 family)